MPCFFHAMGRVCHAGGASFSTGIEMVFGDMSSELGAVIHFLNKTGGKEGNFSHKVGGATLRCVTFPSNLTRKP